MFKKEQNDFRRSYKDKPPDKSKIDNSLFESPTQIMESMGQKKDKCDNDLSSNITKFWDNFITTSDIPSHDIWFQNDGDTVFHDDKIKTDKSNSNAPRNILDIFNTVCLRSNLHPEFEYMQISTGDSHSNNNILNAYIASLSLKNGRGDYIIKHLRSESQFTKKAAKVDVCENTLLFLHDQDPYFYFKQNETASFLDLIPMFKKKKKLPPLLTDQRIAPNGINSNSIAKITADINDISIAVAHIMEKLGTIARELSAMNKWPTATTFFWIILTTIFVLRIYIMDEKYP